MDKQIAETLGQFLGIILGVGLLALLWPTPIVLGVKAAKRKGRSPHWMWFGIHPVGAWIAFLVLRFSSAFKQCPQCGERSKSHARVCPYCTQAFEAEQSLSAVSSDTPDTLTASHRPLNTSVHASLSAATNDSRRPRSITIIAVLQIVFGALGILGIPFTISTLKSASGLSEAQQLLWSDSTWRAWATLGLWLGPLASALWLVVGAGLLRLNPRARSAASGLLLYSIVMSVLGLAVVMKVFWIGPYPAGVVTASQAARSERFVLFCSSFGAAIGSFVYAIVLRNLLKKAAVVDAFRTLSRTQANLVDASSKSQDTTAAALAKSAGRKS